MPGPYPPATTEGPFFTVTNFGAKGDGTTDDTAAIQAAINALPTNPISNKPSGTVFFPPGIYKCGGQLTVPSGTAVQFVGSGKSASVIYYAGGTQQTFITFAGGNNGSIIQGVTICGALADPCVLTLSSGQGAVYNSYITIRDSIVGFGYANGAAFATGTYLSYSGVDVHCDVWVCEASAFYGRNYAMRLRVNTTDAYLTDCTFSSLPQGGESRGIGLWCEDADSSNYFTGKVLASNCSFAQGAEAACLVRSIATMVNCYCESSILPLKGTAVNVKVIGGKWATDNTSAVQLMLFQNNSGGIIVGPYMSAPSGANALTALIRATGSFSTYCWTVILPTKNSVPGTLPASLLAIDQPHIIKFPGYHQGTLSAPGIPTSGSGLYDPFGVDATVYITAGASTVAVSLGGGTLITIPANGVGTIRFPAGSTITLTYTTAPTWTWFGD